MATQDAADKAKTVATKPLNSKQKRHAKQAAARAANGGDNAAKASLAKANKLAKTVAAALKAHTGLKAGVYAHYGTPDSALCTALAGVVSKTNKNGAAYIVGVALRATFGNAADADARWPSYVGITDVYRYTGDKAQAFVGEVTRSAKGGGLECKASRSYTQTAKHGHVCELARNVRTDRTRYAPARTWANSVLADKACQTALVDAVNARAMQLDHLTPAQVAEGKGLTLRKLTTAASKWTKANA